MTSSPSGGERAVPGERLGVRHIGEQPAGGLHTTLVLRAARLAARRPRAQCQGQLDELGKEIRSRTDLGCVHFLPT